MDDRSKEVNTAENGTCEWLLRHETFKRWAELAPDGQGLLWIKGKPGSGKSTLLRYVLDNIRDRAFALSFFFHGRGAELQRTPLGLFRSLLHQLLREFPNALPDLIADFQQQRDSIGEPGERWQWHLHDLQRFFRFSLPKVLENRSVWLFVDALDECGEENAVDLVGKFKSLLRSLSSTGSQFRICFTSRHYPILDMDYGFEIYVERENGQDIETYVQAQLSTFRDRTASTAPALIANRATGIFMWARLVVKRVLDLERRGVGVNRIEEAIYAIPQHLDKLYDELVRSMDEISASLKLIQWICFATRPLSLDELRWAMIVDADCPHKSLQQCQSAEDYAADCNMMERRLKTLSRGLAETVPSSNARVVQFIHQSVQEFFVKKGLSVLDGRLKFPEPEAPETNFAGVAHYQLSRTCIRYLAMEEIARSPGNLGSLMSEFPLLDYATTSWIAHAKQSEARNVPQDDLLDYFTWPSEALVRVWVRVYGQIRRLSCGFPQKETNLVHVVSRYQLIGPLRMILQRADQAGTNIDAKDSKGRTPLSWAAGSGCETVVQLLLDTDKVDADSRDNSGRTPLSLAAKSGRENVVRLLLDTDKVDADPRDNSGRTPLSYASGNGRETAVKLLLAKGVDTDSQDNSGRTPLSWAAGNGRETAVELLLAKGVDADRQDTSGRTPLSWAAGNGRETAVKLLLAKGVDADSQDNSGRTPLSWAAGNRHDGVVELLLFPDRVVDVDRQDNLGRTPLSYAAGNGCEITVQLLLTKEVDTDRHDNSDRTPLSWAAGNGHQNVVQLLLRTEKVVDADRQDNLGRTPLSWAAGEGHEGVVELLLFTDKVVDVDRQDNLGRTPLSWAAGEGHEDVMQMLLLTEKVDAYRQDNLGWTPLIWAVESGYEDVVKFL